MNKQNIIKVGNIEIGNKLPLVLIAGPCQLESREHAFEMAEALTYISEELKIKLIFKTSFDKANRSSLSGKRGMGLAQAMPIFDEIKEELILVIEEKHAKITIDNLPQVEGTKFQIQQLFTNLISNALKYVRPDVHPVITVKSESFITEIINDKMISGDDYYKISVSDNGIGFDQQHADKIFMLFKRLQTDYNYKGTGLGLAICKKIIENHSGYITALGTLNEGSVFNVYLPKKV